ncbi:MAG: hypothetical protein ACOX3T_02925 [Bdellovibrionota bacterium]
MGKLQTNKYSINYALEFINTKENALKAFRITNIIWNTCLFLTIFLIFFLNEEKIFHSFNLNFPFWFICIFINYLITIKRYALIYFINKLQLLNEITNNKLSIIVIIGLLIFTTIIGIFNAMLQTAKIKGVIFINAIIVIAFIVAFVIKSKSIARALLKQIIESNKRNKAEKLQKYHDSLLIVNNGPIILNFAISFFLITFKGTTQVECAILYLLNFLTLYILKPEKKYFLQYCPKCFQIRSLGLSAYPFCPNCRREEWNNVK